MILWDSDSLKEARKEGLGRGSGCLVLSAGKDGHFPLVKADKPVGQWNTFRILLKGDNVTVYLNSELVIADKPYLDPNLTMKLPLKGPILLGSRKSRLWFKNLYIRELPE